jgi:hypothetical protein
MSIVHSCWGSVLLGGEGKMKRINEGKYGQCSLYMCMKIEH